MTESEHLPDPLPEPPTRHTHREPDYSLLPADDWAWTFLQEYLQPKDNRPGVFGKACKAANVSRKAALARIEDDLTFQYLYQEGQTELLEQLEAEAYKRARDGTIKPIYQRGELVGTQREVDNRHLQWLLERLKPTTYHLDTIVEHTHHNAPPTFHFQMGDTELPEIEAGEVEGEATG